MATTLTPGKGDAPSGVHGAFAVVFAGPRGETSDRTEPAITVLFNRAMRDPDNADTSGLPGMRIEASGGAGVPGTWRWVGTHGLLFTPESPLPGSTRFHVTVPSGTRSLDGEALTAAYAFDFATARPKLLESVPGDGAKDVRPETTFRVRFNQPMAPEVVEQAAHLRVTAKVGEAVTTVAVRAAHPKTGKAIDETLVLTPLSKLPKDSQVDLVIDAGIHGDGPLAAAASTTLRFRTYGPLVLANVSCPRSMGPRCEAHRDFTVVLSNAVDPADFKAHLKAPGLKFVQPPKVVNVARKRPPPTTNLLVAADPDFGKRYHLTLTKGLEDVFGQKLDHDLSFDVDTEAPWLADGKSVDGRTPPATRPNATDNDAPDGEHTFVPCGGYGRPASGEARLPRRPRHHRARRRGAREDGDEGAPRPDRRCQRSVVRHGRAEAR